MPLHAPGQNGSNWWTTPRTRHQLIQKRSRIDWLIPRLEPESLGVRTNERRELVAQQVDILVEALGQLGEPQLVCHTRQLGYRLECFLTLLTLALCLFFGPFPFALLLAAYALLFLLGLCLSSALFSRAFFSFTLIVASIIAFRSARSMPCFSAIPSSVR